MTIEKQINHSIAFLDVFISGINNQNLTLQTYQKWKYTGLLFNFISVISFSDKISLSNCLVDRSLKICNNWNSYHHDIESIKFNLIKNVYQPFLIDKVIKKYLNYINNIPSFIVTKAHQKTHLMFITLNYLIPTTCCTILKINFCNFAKNFVKKILMLSQFFVNSKLKTIFLIKTQLLMI